MKNLKWMSLFGLLAFAMIVQAQVTPESQMEQLGRGLVVLPSSSSGKFVSWRMLGTDDEGATTFDVLRNGTVIKAGLKDVTCYNDASGNNTSRYQIVTKVNGVAVDTTAEVKPWSTYFYQLHLDQPDTVGTCSYSPNDCSVGDVDGDGEYEIFVKWDPSNSKDNSHDGKTGNVYIDCYKVDWTTGGAETTPTKLWRIDLGANIRAGAHYTQYMVYDFNGDGLAEMMCKTAPGSKDGLGRYVSEAGTVDAIKNTNNTKNWYNSSGKIDGGYEFLTAFDGLTGKAVHTTFYKPNRNATIVGSEATGSFNWDERSGKTDKASYGNRGERYLACVAYLEGPDANPHAVFVRGYYTYAYLWAVSFDGKEIKDHWYHESNKTNQYTLTSPDGTKKNYPASAPTRGSGSRTMYGNGNHNLSCADVDGDGCDEIIWGSAALDHDGKMLYATGYGHGDAIHLADHNPDRPGLEVFQVHEGSPYGWDLHDAATGEILFSASASDDTGRGIAAQLSSTHRGSFFSCSADRSQRSAVTGEVISTKSTSMNFRIYWDGDLQEELFDGGKIDDWNGNGTSRLYIGGKNPYDYNSSSTCNGSKSTPNLQADLFGDWREELILWNGSTGATLNIFTTNTPTTYRVPTLMHDHTYRMGIAWQNVAYNQPPHLGYYLPDYFLPSIAVVDKTVAEQTIELGDSIAPIMVRYRNATLAALDTIYTPDATLTKLPEEFNREWQIAAKTFILTGKPTKAGDYTFVFRVTNPDDRDDKRYCRAVVHVVDSSEGIEVVGQEAEKQNPDAPVYDLQGRKVATLRQLTDGRALQRGIYIVNGRKVIVD